MMVNKLVYRFPGMMFSLAELLSYVVTTIALPLISTAFGCPSETRDPPMASARESTRITTSATVPGFKPPFVSPPRLSFGGNGTFLFGFSGRQVVSRKICPRDLLANLRFVEPLFFNYS